MRIRVIVGEAPETGTGRCARAVRPALPERLGTGRVGHKCLLPSSSVPRTTENWRISGASRPWGPFPRQKGRKWRCAGRKEAPAPLLEKVSDNGVLSVIYKVLLQTGP